MDKVFQHLLLAFSMSCAIGVDIIYEKVRKAKVTTTIDPPITELFWIRVLGTLLVAGLLIWFVWQVKGKTTDFLTASLTLISGLIPLISLTIWGYFTIGRFFVTPTPLWIEYLALSPIALTSHVAAFAVCVGTIQLVQLFRLRIK